MKNHHLRVYRSEENLDKRNQLAWKIAEVARDSVDIERKVIEMLINRVIDNASVAIASLNRKPVSNARAQAVSHPRLDLSLIHI